MCHPDTLRHTLPALLYLISIISYEASTIIMPTFQNKKTEIQESYILYPRSPSLLMVHLRFER